jgi:hypothetical protein
MDIFDDVKHVSIFKAVCSYHGVYSFVFECIIMSKQMLIALYGEIIGSWKHEITLEMPKEANQKRFASKEANRVNLFP